jgi:hypothetical protein
VSISIDWGIRIESLGLPTFCAAQSLYRPG